MLTRDEKDFSVNSQPLGSRCTASGHKRKIVYIFVTPLSTAWGQETNRQHWRDKTPDQPQKSLWFPLTMSFYNDKSSWPFKKWTYPPAMLLNPSNQYFQKRVGQEGQRKHSWTHQKQAGHRQPFRLVCVQQGEQAHTLLNQSIKAFHVLRSRGPGKCVHQHSWWQRLGEKCTASISHCWRMLSGSQT